MAAGTGSEHGGGDDDAAAGKALVGGGGGGGSGGAAVATVLGHGPQTPMRQVWAEKNARTQRNSNTNIYIYEYVCTDKCKNIHIAMNFSPVHFCLFSRFLSTAGARRGASWYISARVGPPPGRVGSVCGIDFRRVRAGQVPWKPP